MFKYIAHIALQLKGYWVFGRRVGVFGNFKVLRPENVTIGPDCGINHDVFIVGAKRVQIGANVVLSARCMLIDTGLDVRGFAQTPFPSHTDAAIVIEDGAWIGAGAIILGGVTVGRKSIVGAGAVVTRDVSDFTIVAGSPARVIGRTDA